MAGAEGTVVVRGPSGEFQPAVTPETTATLFGIWGPTPETVYAVGFEPQGDAPGVVLKGDPEILEPVENLPVTGDFFKVWGRSADDVWVVGRDDLILHFDGDQWSSRPSGLDEDWITVAGNDELVAIVGGSGNGVVIEPDGDTFAAVSPGFVSPLQGLCLDASGRGLATGIGATFLRRESGAWIEEWDAPFDIVNPAQPPVEGCGYPAPDYHACVSDGQGGWFVVGGKFNGPLTEGALLYEGPPLPTEGL